MADGIHEFTATGRQKKPSEELICSWISEAWNDIPAEMIAAAFLKCGITNSLDGSEDDVVYESTEDANELNLDDSFVRELFASDSESEFEGFWTLNSFASAVSNRYTFYKIVPCFWLTINLVKMVVNQDKISSYYSCKIGRMHANFCK